MPWGSPVEEQRNCTEAVGHGNRLGAQEVGEDLQGAATLFFGYNPDKKTILDPEAQWGAVKGLGQFGLATVVGVASNKAQPLRKFPWVEDQRDIAATAWGEPFGWDQAAQKASGNGGHKWEDDWVAMATKTSWTVVPALLSFGTGGAIKGGLSGIGKGAKGAKFAKGIPDGGRLRNPAKLVAPTSVTAAVQRIDAASGPLGKAYPSGHGPGKPTNSLLDAVDDAPTAQKSPDAPVSNSINTEPSTTAARGQVPESGHAPGPGERGAGQGLGSGVEPRRTVSHKEAPSPWTPDDVKTARKRAGGVDHRTGEPLRPDGPNGERRWHMTWDPEAREWVAENPGKGYTEPSTVAGARKGPAQIGSFAVPDDAVRVTSGSKGNWAHSLYSPEPNKTYLVDDKFAYVTDDRGRVKEAHGILEDAPRDGAGHRQTKAGGVDRLDGDEGGHIFGKSLGGPGEDINLLAMSRDANRSQYAKLENEWRALLKENPPPKIEVTVRPVYEGASQRPSRMLVQWSKDGESQGSRFIHN